MNVLIAMSSQTSVPKVTSSKLQRTFVCVLVHSWLIEVNASPSLTASGPEDYNLKIGLLQDVLHIVDMESRSVCTIFKVESFKKPSASRGNA